MKYLLLVFVPFFALIHALMRYCEWGAKFFGRINDWYIDFLAPKNK